MKITEVFGEAVTLAMKSGARAINQLPGCWEAQVDEHWWIAINGHDADMKCSKGMTVTPFTMYVEFNGWPAGLIDPHGGTLAAGTLANEETLIAALKEAQRRLA